MPTYDYECTKCKHRFEEFQPMTSEPVAICPVCGAKAERKISAGAGFIFKGSGFYETDYRSENYKKAAESEKKLAEKKASDTSKKTESSKKEKTPAATK